MTNRALLEQAAAAFTERHPALTAEALIAFIIVADLEQPTIGEIAVAMGVPDTQVFHHIAPLRDAGLISVTPKRTGSNIVTLSELGHETKEAINGIFEG